MTEKIITNKRFGEALEIREWIKPKTYEVEALAIILGLNVDTYPIEKRVWKVWEYVVKNMEYPLLLGMVPVDSHFVTDYFYKHRSNAFDFWYYPEETLSDGTGDCEDMGILITSLLRTFISEYNALAVIGKVLDANGKLLGYHGWAESQLSVAGGSKTNWYVLEGTLDIMPDGWITREEAYKEGQDFQYVPMIYFNDVTLEILEDIDFGKRYKKFIPPHITEKKLWVIKKIVKLIKK